MTPEPQIRARYMNTFFDLVERLPTEDAQGIRRTIGEPTWSRVRDAGRLAWLPIDTNAVATQAVATQLGPKRTHDFFCNLLLSSFETPLLKGLINAVLRVAGRNPARYLDWVSKGFNMMFRHCGTWRVVERDDSGHATIEVVGLPEAYATDRTWLGTVASSLHALYVVAECEGAVTVRDVDEAEGRAAYRLRWTPPD